MVVYKVDRLGRSLLDFARLIETFDRYCGSIVSVTQQFNTATSMGRLVLNVRSSFAQFDRAIGGQRGNRPPATGGARAAVGRTRVHVL
jgi:site-specific DNA recombinase